MVLRRVWESVEREREREREIKPPGMMSADPQCTYAPATGLGGEEWQQYSKIQQDATIYTKKE